MFIRTISPDSGEILYHEVEVNLSLNRSDRELLQNNEEICQLILRLMVNSITVKETLTIKKFAEQVKRILMADSKIPNNPEKTLIDKFGVSKGAIPELVEYMFSCREGFV